MRLDNSDFDFDYFDSNWVILGGELQNLADRTENCGRRVAGTCDYPRDQYCDRSRPARGLSEPCARWFE
jgi:hypothetical protein